MRSSSSSAPERGFADLLALSLEALERELPGIYARMCATLAPREVRIEVDGEAVSVACTPGEARLLPLPDRPAVEVWTSRAAIVALIDARRTLVESVLSGEVVLRGALGDLVAFHDGLLIYLHGAVRGPSFPRILQLFRRSAPSSSIGDHAGSQEPR